MTGMVPITRSAEAAVISIPIFSARAPTPNASSAATSVGTVDGSSFTREA
jgi:hypothetical protein